jgi:hypothetical protein
LAKIRSEAWSQTALARLTKAAFEIGAAASDS